MMSYKIVFTLLLSSLSLAAKAQPYQHAEYFQASFNQSYLYFNPAYSERAGRFLLNTYWVKEPLYESDIDSRQINGYYRFNSNWTIGLSASQDNFTWHYRLHNLGLIINKRFNFSDETNLTIGTKLSLNQLRFRIESWSLRPDRIWKFRDLAMDFGIWFRHKEFFLGCSVKHLLNNKFELQDGFETYQLKIYPLQAYFLIGQTFKLSKQMNVETTFRFQHIDRTLVESNWKARVDYRNLASFGILYGVRDKYFMGFNLFTNGDFTIPIKVVIKKHVALTASFLPLIFARSTPFQLGLSCAF